MNTPCISYAYNSSIICNIHIHTHTSVKTTKFKLAINTEIYDLYHITKKPENVFAKQTTTLKNAVLATVTHTHNAYIAYRHAMTRDISMNSAENQTSHLTASACKLLRHIYSHAVNFSDSMYLLE